MTLTQEQNIKNFAEYQEEQMALVNAGVISKEQAIVNILDRTIEILLSLKVTDPELENMYQGVTYN